MVKEVLVSSWPCPYCSAKFRDGSDCEDHIMSSHMETPMEKNDLYFKCDVCGEEFDEYTRAFRCEEIHKEHKDLKYRAYLDQVEREKLADLRDRISQIMEHL